MLGLTPDEQQEKFGHLLKAFRLRRAAPRRGRDGPGPPASCCSAGKDSLRDVTAFPKAQSGLDPMTGAPGAGRPGALAELGIAVTVEPEEDESMNEQLTAADRALLGPPNFAWIVTLNPDGSPQATLTWIGANETHVLVEHRRGPAGRTATSSATRTSRSRCSSAVTRTAGSRSRASSSSASSVRAPRTHIDELALAYDGADVDPGRGPGPRALARPARPTSSGTASSEAA